MLFIVHLHLFTFPRRSPVIDLVAPILLLFGSLHRYLLKYEELVIKETFQSLTFKFIHSHFINKCLYLFLPEIIFQSDCSLLIKVSAFLHLHRVVNVIHSDTLLNISFYLQRFLFSSQDE